MKLVCKAYWIDLFEFQAHLSKFYASWYALAFKVRLWAKYEPLDENDEGVGQ